MSRPGAGALFARAAAAQFGGWLLALGAHQLGWLSGPALLGLAGIGAAALAVALRLPWWWWWIELLFPLALALGAGLALPAWTYALLLGASLLLFGGVMISRVPLWLSGRRARALLCAELPNLLPQRRDLDVADLGAGLGGMLAALWRSDRCARCTGIEWAPIPFALGWLRLRLIGFDGSWRWASFWPHPLDGHDLVFAFLSPAAMPRLWDKARAEMRPGSWLVSYRFAIPGAAPDVRVQVGQSRDDALLMWRMPSPRSQAASE